MGGRTQSRHQICRCTSHQASKANLHAPSFSWTHSLPPSQPMNTDTTHVQSMLLFALSDNSSNGRNRQSSPQARNSKRYQQLLKVGFGLRYSRQQSSLCLSLTYSSLCANDVAEDHSKRSVVVGSEASLSDLVGGASREMDDREGAISVGILQIGLPPPKFRLCRRGISTNAFSGL